MTLPSKWFAITTAFDLVVLTRLSSRNKEKMRVQVGKSMFGICRAGGLWPPTEMLSLFAFRDAAGAVDVGW